VFSRQLRAATSSEVIGQSVLFGVTCNGGRSRAWPTAGGVGTPSDYGPRYATDSGLYYAPDQPLDLRAGGTGWADDADTYQWTSRPHTPEAYGQSEPTVVRPGIGLGRLSLHTAGPDDVARANPGSNGWKAETAVSQAGTGRDQDVAL
jgi:hypothetical protein